MVYHKRNQSRWAAKTPAEKNNTYGSEFTKSGIRRTYSEETDLSETCNFSSNSSGDESWSDMSSLQGKTKLSGEAELFVPQQSTQGSGERRTRLSSGASVFVPGQMMSQQVAPAFTTQMPLTHANSPMMFMPEMMPMEPAQTMPMDQVNVAPYMAPYYMAQDGCYYACPVAMPESNFIQPPLPLEAPEASTEAANEPETLKKPEIPRSASASPKSMASASPKSMTSASPKSGKCWADLNDDDDTEDPWFQ